jgi:dihydrodipicolinate synthase/N-acetylneuraminate lyase
VASRCVWTWRCVWNGVGIRISCRQIKYNGYPDDKKESRTPFRLHFSASKENKMDSKIFSGCVPALLTPCKADRTPDFAKLVHKAKELVALGMNAVVYCGSMGDWPLITDEQRMEGVERLAKAGVPVIVGTGAVNTAKAAAHAAHAAKVGARGLMVIPRVLSRGPVVAAQRAHFEAVLSAAPDDRG